MENECVSLLARETYVLKVQINKGGEREGELERGNGRTAERERGCGWIRTIRRLLGCFPVRVPWLMRIKQQQAYGGTVAQKPDGN